MKSYSDQQLYLFQRELADLEREWVDVDGKRFKPSQCYRLTDDPSHILYNTNCPDSLRKRIQALVKKYLEQAPHDE